MADTSNSEADLHQAVLDGSLTATISNLNFEKLEEAGAILAEIHNDGIFDVISYFQALPTVELSSRDRTRIGEVARGFLKGVRDATERIVLFCNGLLETTSDSIAYNIRQGFDVWIAANPAQIGQVATLIGDGDHDSELAGSVLHEWRRIAPSDALEAAILFSESKWPSIRRQATHALGTFKYVNEDEVQLVERRLAALISSANPNDQRAAVFATTRLLEGQTDKSSKLVEALEAAAKQANDEVRHELIAGFSYHRDAYPQTLQAKVLSLMKTVNKKYVQTLDLIDSAFYNMDIDADRNLIFDTLNSLLTQEDEAPLITVFDSWLHKAAAAPHAVHGWYLTRWLLDGDYKICKQLDALFPPLDNSIYEFDIALFSLNESEVRYLVHKIYAYLMFSHGPAVSLLATCLMSLDLNKRRLLEEEIASFWLRNYPIDIGLFDAVQNAYPRKGLDASIRRMRKHVEAYQAPLSALPKNSATQPSTLERRVQAEIAHQFNRDVGKRAHESSIFAELFHKSTLLYGRSSVVYMYPDSSSEPIRQVIPLKSFETSSALPRMDTLYPARLNYLIYRFRIEERPK